MVYDNKDLILNYIDSRCFV